MASSPDTLSMALFCDFENVALGVRDTQHEKFDIKLVLERLLLKGSIVVKKAYCDWERYKGFKSTMHEASFELIEIPHVRQSGKNSADIRLVVDALDLCYTKAHVNTFVIISGDSDFSPLVSKLRENNKQVIGVGVKQSTSDLLTANCDEFIFYDDLVRESGRQSSRREARPPAQARRPAVSSGNPEDDRRSDEAETRRTKAVEMALQTFEALYSERGDGGKIWASVLKEAIKRRKPDFSESYYGFRSFGGLLEEMQARGFLEMGRDEKSNAYVFRSSSAGGAVAAGSQEPVPVAAAPAVPEVLPLMHRAGESEQRERGRGRGARGNRRGTPDRHDFEPTLTVDRHAPAPAQAPAPAAAVQAVDVEVDDHDHDHDDDEADDAAERFADAARQSQATREAVASYDVNADEEAPDADTYVSEPDAVHEAPAPREGNGRRGNRGRGGRNNAARKNAGAPQESSSAANDGRRAQGADRSAPPASASGQRPAQQPARPAAQRPASAPAPAPAPVQAPAPARAAAPAPVASAPTPAPVAAPSEAAPAKTPRARAPARKTTATPAAAPAPVAATAPVPAAKSARKPAAKSAPKAAGTPAAKPAEKTADKAAASARRPRKTAAKPDNA